MIIKGKTRGHARQLGRYLLCDKNDHVEVHEVRGFASDDVMTAMAELDAISKGVKSRQPLFSVILSPPQNESVDVAVYEQAIDRVEQRTGLAGQPRIVIFHEANGRRHAHAVWSRIDPEHMRVAPLRFYGTRLNEVAKETFLEQGWKLPRGFIDRRDRSPERYDHALYQQAKREGLDPARLQLLAKEAWEASKDRQSFETALRQRGLFLARGDSRAFVALTINGEARSLSRLLGRKSKDVVQRLGPPDDLPGVEQARTDIAGALGSALQRLTGDAARAKAEDMTPLETERLAMKEAHAAERRRMDDGIAARWQAEARERAERMRSGFPGLWDRLSGRHREIAEQNEREAFAALQRDRAQRLAMVDAQLIERRELQSRIRAILGAHQRRMEELHRDLAQQIGRDASPEGKERAARAEASRAEHGVPEQPQASPTRLEWQQAQQTRARPAEPEDRPDRVEWLKERYNRHAGVSRDIEPARDVDRDIEPGFDLE